MEGRTDTRENAKATIAGEMRDDKTWFQSATGEIAEGFTRLRQGAVDFAQTTTVWLACLAGTLASVAGGASGAASLAHSAGAPAGTVTDVAAIAGGAAGAVAAFYGTCKAVEASNTSVRKRRIDQGRMETGSWIVQDEDTGQVFRETLHENGKVTSEPTDAGAKARNGVGESAASLDNDGGSVPELV